MKLIIPKAIEDKIHAYVMSVESEIAGMGRVRIDEAGDIVVEDVMIYEQEVTAGTADLSPQAIARWQSALVKAGGSPKAWRLWWHSHDRMDAFFSKRDTDTIDGSTEADWMCSLVVNKRRERQARLDTYRPFRMYMDKLDIKIDGEASYEVPADIAMEVAEKVRRPAPAAAGFGAASARTVIVPAPKTLEAGIGLHRHCPQHSTYGKKRECYMPYGEEGGAYADCTSKAFAKVYGKDPFKVAGKRELALTDTTSKDVAEIMVYTKELEAQSSLLRDSGRGFTDEYMQIQEELIDWYYALADAMPAVDEDVAEGVRAMARNIEDEVSAYVPMESVDTSL